MTHLSEESANQPIPSKGDAEVSDPKNLCEKLARNRCSLLLQSYLREIDMINEEQATALMYAFEGPYEGITDLEARLIEKNVDKTVRRSNPSSVSELTSFQGGGIRVWNCNGHLVYVPTGFKVVLDSEKENGFSIPTAQSLPTANFGRMDNNIPKNSSFEKMLSEDTSDDDTESYENISFPEAEEDIDVAGILSELLKTSESHSVLWDEMERTLRNNVADVMERLEDESLMHKFGLEPLSREKSLRTTILKFLDCVAKNTINVVDSAQKSLVKVRDCTDRNCLPHKSMLTNMIIDLTSRVVSGNHKMMKKALFDGDGGIDPQYVRNSEFNVSHRFIAFNEAVPLHFSEGSPSGRQFFQTATTRAHVHSTRLHHPNPEGSTVFCDCFLNNPSVSNYDLEDLELESNHSSLL